MEYFYSLYCNTCKSKIVTDYYKEEVVIKSVVKLTFIAVRGELKKLVSEGKYKDVPLFVDKTKVKLCDKSGEDLYCCYYLLHCRHCEADLGRIYCTTNEIMTKYRDLVLLQEEHLIMDIEGMTKIKKGNKNENQIDTEAIEKEIHKKEEQAFTEVKYKELIELKLWQKEELLNINTFCGEFGDILWEMQSRVNESKQEVKEMKKVVEKLLTDREKRQR